MLLIQDNDLRGIITGIGHVWVFYFLIRNFLLQKSNKNAVYITYE